DGAGRRGAIHGRAIDLVRHRHRARAGGPGRHRAAGATRPAAGLRRDAGGRLGRRVRAGRRLDPAGARGVDPGVDRRGFPGLGRGCAPGRCVPAGRGRRGGRHRGGAVLRPCGRVRRPVRGRRGRRTGGTARLRTACDRTGREGRHRHLVRPLRRHRAQADPGLRDDRHLRPGLVDRLTRPFGAPARLRLSGLPDPMPANRTARARGPWSRALLLTVLLSATALLAPQAAALQSSSQGGEPTATVQVDAEAAASPPGPGPESESTSEPAPALVADTDEGAADAWLPDGKQVRGRFDFTFDRVISQLAGLVANLPLLLAAIAIIALATWISGFVSRRLHLLRLRTDNPYMNGLIRNVVRTVIVLCGVLIALDLLNATALVTAALGSEGVVGLLLGFPSKDVAENYI